MNPPGAAESQAPSGSHRCRSCGGAFMEGPEGGELCPACRTERLPVADLIGEPSDWSGPLSGPGGEPGEDERAPLHGRAEVLRRLALLCAEAQRQREVRFCLVVGAPGVGKSRLLRELYRVLAMRMDPPFRVFSSAASEGAPPLSLFAEQLCQRFDIHPREPAGSARDKLISGCRALLPGVRATEVAHLLGELLRVPFPDSPVSDVRAPGRPEPRLYQAIKRLLSADAARGPVALLFDDLEHATAESVNLLHYLAAGLSGSPVFLCAFARPEIDEAHPSFGKGEVACERVDLGPLSAADSVAVLRGLCGAEVPREVVRHVEIHLSGSPRAIHELVRLLGETGVLTESGTFHRERLRRLNLPTTLEDLVAARLRAMDPIERELLGQAAICGERFYVDAVVALSRASEVGLGMPAVHTDGGPDPDGPTLEEIVVAGDRATHQVKATLRQLEARGLVVPLPHSAIRGEREYRFAYPPWRDVIYDGLPLSKRRAYHGLLAQWLELCAEGGREEMQEAIGRHLERAGKGDAAAQRYLRAAEAARDRYAPARATRLYARAIACLGTSDLATRIRLWHELGTVFHQKGDYDNAHNAYEKVVRLSWVLSSRQKAATALLHMGEIWRQKGELQLSLDYLSQALDLFQQAGDQVGLTDTLDDIGQVLWLLGRYKEALDRSAAALEIRRRIGDKAKIATSLLTIGNIERHRGLFPEAEACYKEALSLRRGLSDKLGIAACQNAIGMLAYQRGDLQAARRTWEEALVLCEEAGAPPLKAVLLCHLGDVLLKEGQLPQAEARFTAAQALARELQDKRLLSESERSLGLIALRQGDVQKGRKRLQEALRLAEEAGVRLDIGRALLALGEAHAATLFDGAAGEEAGAEALDFYTRGVQLLRDIGNEAELAQGLIRKARFHIERGEEDEGRALLDEVQAIHERLHIVRDDELERLLQEL